MAMLTPERLLRFMIELIFVLLGALLVWLGLAGPLYGRTVDRHSRGWLILKRRTDSHRGTPRALQAGPVVAALARTGRAGFRSHFWASSCS